MSEDDIGTYFASGDNTDGQLGVNVGRVESSFVKGKGLLGQAIKKASLGFRHSMALTHSGELYVWGSSANNQLGTGYNDRSVGSPLKLDIDSGSKVVEIATKSNFCAAITEDGTLYTWGYNGNYGNLGRPGDDAVPTPVVEGFRGCSIRSVALGNDHALALSSDGLVFAWGRGEECQLGFEVDTIEHVIPKEIEFFSKLLIERPFSNRVTQIACGKSFSMALNASGDVYTWGSNSDGQCGHGNLADVPQPRRIEKLVSKFVTQIACGWRHACAITDQGELHTWGGNEAGQLGTCDRLIRRTPTRVYALAGEAVKEVAAGWRHTIARIDIGYVYAWGACDRGQCGRRSDGMQKIDATTTLDGVSALPTTSTKSIPVSECFLAPQLVFKSQAIGSLAAGYEHSLLIPELPTSDSLSRDMLDLFDETNREQSGDIVFEVQEEKLYAHSEIVAVRCPNLSKYIETTSVIVMDEYEHSNRKKHVVMIVDVQPYVFRAFLMYLYSDVNVVEVNIDPKHGTLFNMDNIEVSEEEIHHYEKFRNFFPRPKYEYRQADLNLATDLLPLAEKYRIVRLKQICQNYVQKTYVPPVRSSLPRDLLQLRRNSEFHDTYDVLFSHPKCASNMGVHSYMMRIRTPLFYRRVIGESTAIHNPNTTNLHSVDELKPEAFNMVLDYMYGGIINLDTREELLYDLIEVASSIKVPPLISYCETCLGIDPKLHNVAIILNEARKTTASRLEMRCYYIMSRNMKELESMLGLSEEDFKKVRDLRRVMEELEPVLDDRQRPRTQSAQNKTTQTSAGESITRKTNRKRGKKGFTAADRLMQSPRGKATHFTPAETLSGFGLATQRKNSLQSNSRTSTANDQKRVQKTGSLQLKVQGFMGGWKKKWVVLQGYDLFVFDDQKDAKARVQVDMIHSVMISPPLVLDSTTRKGTSFELFEGERSYVFHTDNASEGEEWLKSLSESLHDAKLILNLSMNRAPTNFIRNGYALVTKVDANYTGSVLQIRPEIRWLDLQPESLLFYPRASVDPNIAGRVIDTIDLGRTSIEVPQSFKKANVFAFIIRTSQHDYVIRGGAESHVLSWVVSLKRNIHQINKFYESKTYCEGRLVKHSSLAWKGNSVGWFVLKDGILYRYVHDKANVPEKTVSLEGCTVRLVNDPGSKPGFILDSLERSIRFESPSVAEAEAWVNAIQAFLSKEQGDTDPIIKQGYLYKDPKGVLLKARYRWFVLRSATLSYYVKPSDADPIHTFNIKDISVSNPSNGTDDPTFLLHTAKRNYVMIASSKEEMNSWLQALMQVTQRKSTSWFQSDMKSFERSRALSCPARFQDIPITMEEKTILGGDAHLPMSRRSSVASLWNEPPPCIGFESDEEDDPDILLGASPLDALIFDDLRQSFIRGRSGTVLTVDTKATDVSSEATRESTDERFSNTAPPASSMVYAYKSFDDIYIDCNFKGAANEWDQFHHRDQSSPSVVIDTGATMTRFGYAGYEHPVALFPTSLSYVEESISKKSQVSLKKHSMSTAKSYYFDSPLDPKRSPNWDDLVQVWQHGYDNELNLHAEERGVLMVEPIGISLKSREKLLEIFFETFQVPYYALKPPSLLSLVALENQSGLVVNWGSKLQITAVSNGYILPHQTVVRNFGGFDLTDMMHTLLNRERPAESHFSKSDACWVKESLCYMCNNFQQEIEASSDQPMKRVTKTPYTNQDLSICAERFICPEALFDPSLLRVDSLGLHELVYDTITGCDIDIRRSLFTNIVLSGGNTLFPGFGTRLQTDVQRLIAKNSTSRLTCKVVEKANRKYLPFIGGTKYAAMPAFADNCFYLNDYYEHGTSILSL